MIQLVRYLLRTSRAVRFSRGAVLVALATGLLSGAGYTLLIALANSALTAGKRGSGLLLGFALLCVGVSLTRLLSQGLFDYLGARSVFDVRLQLCRQILVTPLRKLEEVGAHRLLAVLSEDVTTISTALTQLPRLCMNLAIAFACLFYMGWLSWRLLLLTLGFMAVGIITYQIPMQRANRFFRRLREQRDAQFAELRALIHGAKELKLQRRRRRELVRSELTPTSEAIRHLTFAGNAVFAVGAVWGNLLFFIVFGLLVFGLGWRGWIAPRVVTGYTLTLLYLATPLELLLFALPTLGRAAAAARKLDSLGLELAAAPEPEGGGERPAAPWQSLELVDVAYTYPGARQGDDESFHIGPLRLSLRPGELVFLIGGNGSGKTTLAKVLTGLYPPDQGEIRVDGRPVTDASRDDYRQMFSAVYADFHLFHSLIARVDGRDEVARGYLARLQLADRVQVVEGRLSTLDLSQGQRKRLALLNSYLEDRPIYFFDEWAADQDPEFREIFYLEILPELRARGKAVLAISHDDHYYGVADRLIKLTGGRIEWDRERADPVVAETV